MSNQARGLTGVLLGTALLAGGFTLTRNGIYGWTVFVLMPMLVGALTEWLTSAETPGRAAKNGALATLAGLGLFLVFGFEGLYCIAMAAPLALPLGALGAWLAHQARRAGSKHGLAALLLVPPAALTWDVNALPPVFEVRTVIEIKAAPEQVWQNVVSFPDLPEPAEWFFRAGLAYPQRARIVGSGPGAMRYCEFSTGPFVEPVEVWNPPHLLSFRVTQNPPPMHEWSPYRLVLPKHLHGYMVSKKGQFRLTALPGGRTLLEGTTWYRHGLWPAQYWRWWSDAIVHRIHLRVLNHIRTLSERAS